MRPIWKFIIITIAAGAILSLVALSMGAGSGGFYVDKTGVHVVTDEEKELLVELDIGKVKDIDVDVSFSDIELLSSNKYGIEILGYDSDWTWDLKNGTLKIQHSDSPKFFISNFNFSQKPDSVKIYIPKDADLGDVSVKTGSGEIKVGSFIANDVQIHNSFGNVDISDITGDRIKIVVNSGKFTGQDLMVEKLDYTNHFGSGYLDTVTAEEFVADISSGSFDIQDCIVEDLEMTNKFGDIDAKNLNTSKANISVSSGRINLDGEFSGKTVLNSSFGDIKLSTSKPKEEYSYNVDASFGNIMFDSERMGNNNSVKMDNGSKNSLDIKASSGDIDVKFGK